MIHHNKAVLALLALLFIVSCKNSKIECVQQDTISSMASREYRQLDPLLVLELPEAEVHFLQQYPDRAERNSDTLFVYLRNGTTKIYTNTALDTERQKKYRFYGQIDGLPYLLITIEEYEDFSISLLHDSTGSEYVLESRPYLSPDKHHFVTSYNNMVDESFNVTKVWSIDDHTVALKFEQRIPDCSSVSVEWLTDRAFRYRARYRSSANEDTIVIANIDGEWRQQ